MDSEVTILLGSSNLTSNQLRLFQRQMLADFEHQFLEVSEVTNHFRLQRELVHIVDNGMKLSNGLFGSAEGF